MLSDQIKAKINKIVEQETVTLLEKNLPPVPIEKAKDELLKEMDFEPNLDADISFSNARIRNFFINHNNCGNLS